MAKAKTREVKTREVKTRETKKASGGFRWRLWLGVFAAAGMCVSSALAARHVHHYVTTGEQFRLARDRRDAVLIQGLRLANRSKVQRVFAGDYGRSIFSVPLEERRRRLLAIDWVEEATVARVWPDRLVVKVKERQPVAFVSLRTGVMLIDRFGVLMELPAQASFAFPVMGGVTEQDTEEVRATRVEAMLRLQEDLGGMAKDVSEVNTADPENLRLIAQANGKAVELWMGDTNFARRYKDFLGHYSEIQKRSPNAKLFDLRMDGRILTKE